MIKKIAGVLAVAVLVVLGLAARQPNAFRVERSALIKAKPEKVHAFLNDFHNWQSWSPWEKLDPGMSRTLSGAQKGQGAVYEWKGNSQAGQGRMEIVESSPDKIVIKLDFIKPFAASDVAEYLLAPEGAGTKVTWAMHGPMPFVSKLMCLFMSMDKMVGKDFEEGLANLAKVVEK